MEYQHQPDRSTGYTPFFMVYGAKAVLPSDIHHNSPRVAAYVEADNEKARQDSLDLLDEERDLAAARSAIYQQDHICLDVLLVAHPQSNGQAERSNQEILRGINPGLWSLYRGRRVVGLRSCLQ